MNKILKIMSNVLLVIVILILGSYVLLKCTGKMSIYKILTGSMETGIHAGDYIVINKSSEYKKGDIVTYEKNGYYITHRIIDINDEVVTTKGDANNVPDEEITKSNIEGKLLYKGKILNIIMNYKFIIMGLMIGLFILSSYLNNDRKKVMQ